MTRVNNEARALKAMLEYGALSEQTGLSGKEIIELSGVKSTSARLTDAKYMGRVKNGGIKSVYWLTQKGIDFVNSCNWADEPTKECTDAPQCPASVGGDIDPDNETQNVYTEENNSMLDEPLDIPEPEYDPAVVAFSQHTDAFINAINEKDYISGIVVENTQVHFELIDHHGDKVGTFDDPFSAMNDALKHAAVGGKFTVEKVIVERIGAAKPVTSSVWEFA